jgi:type VI secretion system protein ImpK
MTMRVGIANGESFLLAQFREFYEEVVRWKRLASREAETLPVAALAIVGGGETAVRQGGSPVGVMPSAIWQALLGLLNRQEAEVRRTGGEYASALYRRVQYVMAALADETFLYLDWPGRDAWRANLLEFKLFQSYRAGEEVFRRIDALLRTRDPADLEVARIYLLALGLGFRGSLRGPEGEARIDAYRRELYTFLTNRDPGASREPHSLFPEAYQSNIETSGSSRRLSPGRRWLLAGLLLLLGWILLSHHIWTTTIEDLRPLIDVIIGQQR